MNKKPTEPNRGKKFFLKEELKRIVLAERQLAGGDWPIEALAEAAEDLRALQELERLPPWNRKADAAR